MYERLSGKHARMKYTPAWQLRLMSRLYAPFNQTKSRFLAFRHDLAASNWRVDMSEVVKRYPVRLTCLEDVVRISCIK